MLFSVVGWEWLFAKPATSLRAYAFPFFYMGGLCCFRLYPQNTHAVAWGGANESRGRHRVCRFSRNRQTEFKIQKAKFKIIYFPLIFKD